MQLTVIDMVDWGCWLGDGDHASSIAQPPHQRSMCEIATFLREPFCIERCTAL